MPASLRAFIAAELPGDLRPELGRVQAALAAAGVRARWARPESIHLTLKFLGQVPVEAIARVAEGLAEAVDGQPAFRLAVGGLGAFPGLRRPRVVWVGLAGDIEALAGLQRRLEHCAKPIQDIAWKAQVRLCKRYRRLVARGKNANVVVTAIAREILAFLWAIAREVPVTH
jgi:2'-5' RNA ligase